MTTTPLQDATALAERIQSLLHNAPAGSPELAAYAEAHSHLQRCCAALARLPEPQYRMLEVGEVIKEGDEVERFDGWNKVGMTIGSHLHPKSVGAFRRLVAPMPQRYRLLEKAEILERGDEIRTLGTTGAWAPVSASIGKPLNPAYEGRRRVATAQDFRDIENMLVRCNSVYAQGMKQEEKA